MDISESGYFNWFSWPTFIKADGEGSVCAGTSANNDQTQCLLSGWLGTSGYGGSVTIDPGA
jgi:hypothetical protein